MFNVQHPELVFALDCISRVSIHRSSLPRRLRIHLITDPYTAPERCGIMTQKKHVSSVPKVRTLVVLKTRVNQSFCNEARSSEVECGPSLCMREGERELNRKL